MQQSKNPGIDPQIPGQLVAKVLRQFSRKNKSPFKNWCRTPESAYEKSKMNIYHTKTVIWDRSYT